MLLSAFTDILDLPFADSVRALKDLGLTCVDLRTKLGPYTVDTITPDTAEQTARELQRQGVRVASIASWGVNPMNGGYDPFSPDYRKTMRERVTHLAAFAELVGAAHVRIYSLTRPGGPIEDTCRDANAAFLAELAGLCAGFGVTLLVENEPPTMTATCAELGDLMRRANHPHLKVNWDIVNGWRAGEVPWSPGVFENIAGQIAQIHIKGARANPDGSFHSMAIPGADDVPHATLFQSLRKSGFDGVLTIDPHYNQFAPEDRLDNVPNAVLEVVRRTITFLNGVLKA
jgi:sugar phosphate isomerase/epimerase